MASIVTLGDKSSRGYNMKLSDSNRGQILAALVGIIALGAGLSAATWTVSKAGKVAGLIGEPVPTASAPPRPLLCRALL